MGLPTFAICIIHQSAIERGILSVGSFNYFFDDGVHYCVPTEEVERYRDQCLEEMPAISSFADRISQCFWVDLLALDRRYHIGIHSVLQPLLGLEAGEGPLGLKPATPFTRLPLKGLWHKHWSCARFIPANILAVTQRKGSMDWIWDHAKEGDILTEKLINLIAHKMTVGAYISRHAAKQITGEWIIFLPRSGLNHYLCLGTHLTGDMSLNDKIRSLCALDFPDIGLWIDEVAASL